MKVIAILATVVGLLVAPTASADPVRHFDTFFIECGGQQFELVLKPGSSNFVGSTSVSILMGFTVIDNATGAVVDEFHKPFTEHQDVTVCEDRNEPGVTVLVELLNTPRAE